MSHTEPFPHASSRQGTPLADTCSCHVKPKINK